MGLIGGAGQIGFKFMEQRSNANRDTRPVLVRLSDSSWWPLKSLSDDEYEAMLRDKIKMADAEIAGLDAQIKALRAKDPEKSNTVS